LSPTGIPINFAIGPGAVGVGSGVVAIGGDISGVADNASRVANAANAFGTGAVALGDGTLASGPGAVAWGAPFTGDPANVADTTTTTQGLTAIGPGAFAGDRASFEAFDPADPVNTFVTPTVVNATAVGANATAEANGATAMGHNAGAFGPSSTAMGEGATARGGGSVAIGGGSETGNSGVGASQATAIGANTDASANHSSAIGAGAGNNANSSAPSNALSPGGTPTQVGEMRFGVAPGEYTPNLDGNTYTMGGVTSQLSRDRQQGRLQLVTTDAAGHLASDQGLVAKGIARAQAGIAIALAIEAPSLGTNENFGIRLGWGNLDGDANAFGLSAMGVLCRGCLGAGTRVALDAGIGFSSSDFSGYSESAAAGRAGVQITWK
jgi:hypothetical protein